MIYFIVIFWIAVVWASLLNCIIFRSTSQADLTVTGLCCRSFCEHCKKTIRFLYVIPVFGFFFSAGRCHHCQGKISHYHIISELFSGILAVCIYLLMREKGVVIFFLFLTLIAISFIDLKQKIIPFVLTIPIFICGLYYSVCDLTLSERLYGAVCGFTVTLLAMIVVSVLRKENTVAGGDIALITCAGVWLGLHRVPLFILITALLFVAYALPGRIRGNIYTPMGPAICSGFSLCLMLHLIT